MTNFIENSLINNEHLLRIKIVLFIKMIKNVYIIF